MENEAKLEIGYGLAKGGEAFAAGVKAAKQALTGIQEYAPSLVLVFASVRYELEELLRGVHTVVGDTPVVGATTAGEIYNGAHHESVVVTVLASPYLEVRVGLGQGVSQGWQQAVAQAVSAPGLAPFFSPDDNTAWSELILQGKSAFALMFAPGETFTSILRSFEILEELKRLSQNRLPVIGGCAGDDLRMETNYVIWGGQAYPDSLLLVICQTQLRFGIAMAHGFNPTAQRVMVTRACDHEVLELDGQTAAEVYSRVQGHTRESLEGQHLTLITGRPLGILDPYGQYSINVAAYFTPNGGLRVAQPVSEGTILTVMAGTPESMAAAGREALRKALLRGAITQAATILAFSCVLRASSLGDRLVEETRGIRQILPDVPITGFYSMGEQGLADDGVNRNNTEAITVLVLGRELSYAAQVALERERLRGEVGQAEELRVANATLQKEVAERQKAEHALHHSERFLANVFDSIQDSLTILDADFNIIRVNPTAERWFSRCSPQMGKKCYAVHHGRQEPCEVCPARQTLETGKAAYKMTSVSPGGVASGWVEVYTYPLVDPASGKITGVIEYAKDVTERVRAEEALHNSQEKFRLVTETIQDVFWMSDPAVNEIIYVSPAYEQVWGRTCQSLYASPRSFVEAIHPEDRQEAVATMMETHPQGKPYGHEYRIIRPDGAVRWIHDRGFPIKDEQGRPYMMTGVATDITARKQAEQALQESEKNYRRIVETASEGIWLIDAENKVTFVSSRMAEMLRHTEDDLLGKPISVFLEGEWLTIALTAITDGLQKGFNQQLDLKFTRKDGTELWGIVFATPILDARGKYDGALGMVGDITRRKQAEEALSRSEEQLRQSQKMEAVGRLAGGVAHDFNNILTAISGYSELLIQNLGDQNPLNQDVQEIQRAADRAATLTQQLLAFSRKQVIQPQRLDLNEVVANMDKMVRRIIREDIDLQTILEPDLGVVIADQGQIEQVILNLVVNAGDAMPQGGKLTLETGNVELDESYVQRHVQAQPGPYVLIAVSDTGIGLDQEVQEHLFEPFFTTKKPGKGTGLGLSMAYAIVNHGGGFIGVYSEKGQGTTFKIYLPRLEKSREPAILPLILPSEEVISETILLAEDEEVVRRVTGRILEGSGYTVLQAGSGPEALSISEQHKAPIHLLLTDVLMPEMSGAKLAEALTPLRPEMKVLFMSGHTENAIVHHGVLEPGIAFIQKPFRRDTLLRKVRAVLNSSEVRNFPALK